MKLSTRIADQWLGMASRRVAMDKNMAVAISDLIRSEIDSDVSGIDWQWNVKAEDLTEGFGWKDKKLSFPGKPTELEADGTLGGILIKAECSVEPTPGAKGIVIQIQGGYFHKLSQGGQEYSRVQPMGAYDIDIDDNGHPSWSLDAETKQEQNFNPLYTGVRALIGDIVGAKINPSAAKKRKIDRQKELEKLQEKQRNKDAPKFESVPEFISYIQENHEGVYGGPLLQQLLHSLYKSNDERMANKKKIIQELTAAGLKYNIRNTETASTQPEELAQTLLTIADAIDAAQNPSAQKVASALLEVLQLLG